jgi:hypothetical protein
MTFDAEDPHEIGKSGGDRVDRSRGAAKAITVSNMFNRRVRPDCYRAQGFIDPGLKWADISWFKSITKSSSRLSDFVDINLIEPWCDHSATHPQGCADLGGCH